MNRPCTYPNDDTDYEAFPTANRPSDEWLDAYYATQPKTLAELLQRRLDRYQRGVSAAAATGQPIAPPECLDLYAMQELAEMAGTFIACSNGGRKGGIANRETIASDVQLRSEAVKFLKLLPDWSRGAGELAMRVTGRELTQATRRVRKGLKLLSREDAWPVGKQGPKGKSSSKG
jgi:hypothetical protein